MNRNEMLTPKEEEILCLIWDKNVPLTTMEISEYMIERGWSRVTVFKTVQKLIETEYLKIVGVEKVAKAYSRTLFPACSKNEYFSDILHKRGFDSKTVAGLVMSFLDIKAGDKQKKSDELIKKMEKIIEEISKED